MELRQLKYFVAVAEELHFGHAAARLHIATSPLSQQIKQLERALGFPLFERSTRAVTLTAGGQALLPLARDLLLRADEAVEIAAKHHHGQAGSINVGYAGFSTSKLIPEITRVFHERYPDITVSVRGESLSLTQVHALHNATLDVGFIRPTAGDDRINSRVLFQEEVVVALPSAHPLAARGELTPDVLASEPFILYEECSTLDGAIRQIRETTGLRPHEAELAADTYSVVSMVAAGLGLAFVPAGITTYGVDGVEYARLLTTPRVRVPLCIAWRHDSARSQIIRNYYAVAKEIVDRHATSNMTPKGIVATF